MSDLEMEYYQTDSCPEKVYSDLVKEVKNCKKCDLGCEKLLDGHNPHVMGSGNIESEILFIAESPGLQETIHGHPLAATGVSGKIYEKLLKRLDLTREDVYTTNIVLCSPKQNRDPEPWEVHKCKPFLERQIKLVNPKIIITFGRFAAQAMLGFFKITKDHGKLSHSELFNVNVFPLYHPAYIGAYANKEKREEFKADVDKLKELLKNINGE